MRARTPPNPEPRILCLSTEKTESVLCMRRGTAVSRHEVAGEQRLQQNWYVQTNGRRTEVG